MSFEGVLLFLSMWLAVRYWCHTPGSKPKLTEKVDDKQQNLVGLVWFCQFETNSAHW